ncbi:Phosphoserine aminotransferase 2, chloroplastic [Rhodotorula toruloides]|nr:Phosphoserine aminotransferase 2, chloroplastic [Rhodotorula toruloides]
MADFTKQLAERANTINMNAGPSPLPDAALLTAAASLLSYPETPGMGIAEISHRSPAFDNVVVKANDDLRKLLEIPSNYRILWMQGGGLTQFAATALNLLAWYRIKNQLKPEDEVDAWYAVTGSWSKKAAEEGARVGVNAKKVFDGKKYGGGKFKGIPPASEWEIPQLEENGRKPAFVYYCDNETVDGIEFGGVGSETAFPFDKFDPEVPVAADMSSNFLSRPVDVSKYGIIYAGAQKNLGPAGVTLVIIREDLIVDLDEAVKYGGARVPSMLSYKNMADTNSMYNTPPTFTIYVCSLVLRSLLASPPLPLSSPDARPLSPLSDFADQKSSLIYAELDDGSGFYVGTADKAVRSRMNPTFRLKGGEELEKKFVKAASDKGIKGVNGHRSVGGIRTSIYNAVTLEQVKTLVAFMRELLLPVLFASCCVALSGSPRLERRASPRPVFAHVGKSSFIQVIWLILTASTSAVQGNFQNYGEDDYAADFKLAKEAGIDAFALNVGHDSTDPAQLAKAFSAAKSSSFKLFFSFDMNYFSKPASSDTILSDYLGKYGGNDAHLLYNGKVFVSTFSGEVPGTFLDGAGSFTESNAKWTDLLAKAKSAIGKDAADAHDSFVPDWNDVNLVAQNKWGGGVMSWAAWGDKGRTTAMTTASDQAVHLSVPSLNTQRSTDPAVTQYIAAASKANLAYLAPVAAFFFVHVAAGNNYVLNSNDFLLPADLIALNPGVRTVAAVSRRSPLTLSIQPAYVELLSWNDFGESHYLGPVRASAGVPSGATAYADTKHDHLPMLWLSAYYNIWFKSGSPPPISTECLVWWYRPHPAKVSATSDPLSAPQYAETLDDKVFAAIFVPQGSKARKVVINAGGQAQSQDVKEGVNLVSVTFQVGKTRISLVDSSNKELLSGSGADIVATPSSFDFNFRSYIFPKDATASTCFGSGAVAGTATGAPPSSGIATSAMSSKMSSAPASGSSTSSSAPSDDTTVASILQPSQSQSLAPSPLLTSAAPSDDSSTSSLPSTSFGVPAYGWIVAGVIILVLLLLIVFAATRSKPAERARSGQTMDESDGGDGDGTSDSDSSDSEDGLISRRRNS